MARKSSRRDFLRGTAAQDALADAAQRAASVTGPHDPSAATEGQGYVVRVSRQAMACEFELRLNAGQYDDGTQRALEALDLIDALEEQLSAFRETSELSRVNQQAADHPVEVSAELFDLVEMAMQLSRQTDGAFDITAAPLSRLWGFTQRHPSVPDEAQLTTALESVGRELVELDATQQTIHFRRGGVQLNLGSIGKGYALDRCTQSLLEVGIDDFLFHGGNSSVLGRGRPSTPNHPDTKHRAFGWTVGVRNPLRPEQRVAEIRLADRALATSGSWAQSFVYEGRRLGHVLDPRTGWPAEGILSATAVAPSAALADALSTAFYVMGPERSLAYCHERPELGAVLVCPQRRRGGFDVQTVGLSDDELTLYR